MDRWKMRREILRTKRQLLFEDFEKRPTRVTLALEIKAIDDEIAACNEYAKRERINESLSR